MDSDTRRIVIGIGLLAVGLGIYGVTSSYATGVMVQELQSGTYCEGSSCFWTTLIVSLVSIVGAALSIAGVILLLLAVFRKLGKSAVSSTSAFR